MAVGIQALSDVQADALREAANIGMGHAATSLADMTGGEFRISVPSFGVVAMSMFADVVGDMEALAVAVYMPVEGVAIGHVAFLCPFRSACELADMLIGLPLGTTHSLGEMECSALTEVGNIIISSFLNALSSLTGMSLPPAPPGIAVDMTGAILGSMAAVSPSLGDHALTIMTRLADAEQSVEGVFLFIPEPDALDALFQALGMDA